MARARTYALMLAVAVSALFGSVAARAVQPDEILPDPALEARARGLSQQLRCMVCQNQSIDDSDAPLARDLRLLVRERLKTGESDEQVLDFLTVRYGQFVLLKPRFGWDTVALWLAPAAVLLIGACGLVVLMQRRRKSGVPEVADSPLSEAERTRLAELVGNPEKPAGTPS